MESAMIDFAGVTFQYPSQSLPALRDVSLQIRAGSFLLVIGASGTGKSTLLRCLNGLVPHFYGGTLRGRIRVGDRDPVALGPRGMSDLVGFVFQDPESQFVTQVVEDELAFALENHNIAPAQMRRRVEEALDQLSIADLRTCRVDTLSGGQQQLVAIASALTLQPSILVLDEPTSQLDPQAAEEVLTILQRLNHDLGLTIVLSEHRLERVAQYADQICYLPENGAPPFVGDPGSVLARAHLVPPLVELGRNLGWQPLPLTLKAARQFVPNLQARLKAQPSFVPPIMSAPEKISARAQEPAIAVEHLWFGYDGREILKDVSVRVEVGETVALMGRNGSGKTTLLKNLIGLLPPAHGKVKIAGMDARTTPLTELARRVGFVPQNPGRLLFNETLEKELRFTCRAHGLAETNIAPLLARLGLGELASAYPRDLSTGERQRAALAAILIANPKVLLLDEPTRGLDYDSKEKLLAILADLSRDGVAILLATHDVELVAKCASRILILGDGEIVVDGPTRAVMNDSLVFASQVSKLLRDERYVTVADVLAQLNATQDLDD